MTFALRNAVLQVHRWTGLTVGLVAIFLAATGLTMVFRPQLQPLAEKNLRAVTSCGARLPLDTLVANARAFHPGVAVAQIQVTGGGFGATIVRFKDLQGVHVDPCNGAILGERHRWGGFFNTVEQLHRFRFVDNADLTELFGGSVSLILAVVLVGGGLFVWWPASFRALKGALKLRPRLKGHAFELNLHRTLGVYVSAILLVSALSSLAFTFEWARHAIDTATGSPPPPRKPLLDEERRGTMVAVEMFLQRTFALVPKAEDVMLILPRKAADPVEIYAVERDAPHPNARTYLYLDPSSAAVVRFDPYAQSSTGNKVYRWLASLHMGQIGGIPGQIALFLGILGIPVLGYTGIRSFLRGRSRKIPAR